MPEKKAIIIHDVGLRDGLQMEKETVPLETKIEWAKSLASAGVDIIQLGSFVHPTKVPQMADTDELFEYFSKSEEKLKNATFSGLVLNEKGLERGMKCGTEMFCMGVSASETHSLKNTGMTTAEAQRRIIAMAKEAMAAGKRVQVSVQSAFGCGFEGDVPEEKVYGIIEEYLNAGARVVSLADTAGYANPAKVKRMISKIREMDESIEIACHFHNTFGMGMANVYAAYKAGAVYFEGAFGGLGGCPFTKLAAGNVATEDLTLMFQEMGLRKDIDAKKIADVAKYASGFFVRDLPGYVYKAGFIKH